jgi:hypothetical protein
MTVMAAKTGLSVEQYQQLSFAAREVGVSHEQLDAALGMFAKNIGLAAGGTGSARKAFDELHLSVRDAQGNIKSEADLFEQFAEKISHVKDPAERAKLAVEAFGRGGDQTSEKSKVSGMDTLVRGLNARP